MQKQKRIKTGIIVLSICLLVVLGSFSAFLLYTNHVKNSIQIVEIPEFLSEALPEETPELEGTFGSLKRANTESPIITKCFLYSGKKKDIYYVPFLSHSVLDIESSGLAYGGCQVIVKKITVKDGKIVENSFLDGNKMRLKVAIDTGEGVFIGATTCRIPPDENSPWTHYDPGKLPYRIQHEINCPLAKCRQEEGCQYFIDLVFHGRNDTEDEFFNMIEVLTEPGTYEGKLEIECSIGKKKIETEWVWEYVVKPREMDE